eukprot:116589-Pyramimonas_sp.AAC.1
MGTGVDVTGTSVDVMGTASVDVMGTGVDVMGTTGEFESPVVERNLWGLAADSRLNCPFAAPA